MALKFHLFFVFSLLICLSISEQNDIKERSLIPNPSQNESNKETVHRKIYHQLNQIVYSSPENKNYYLITLYISEAKKRQTYLIDTGSDTMTSSCSMEPGQNHNKNNFIYGEKNSTFTKIKCDSKICNLLPSNRCQGKEKETNKENLCSYDNNIQGIKGYYVKDIAYLEELGPHLSLFSRRKYHSFALPIGCTTDEYGKYKDIMVDGILGVNNSPKSFVGLLYKLKIIKKDMFSLCFSPRGGYMSLGEIDPKYHYKRSINYVPLLDSDTYYKIKVNCLSVENNDNNNNNSTNYIKINKEAQIDTGYNITYFPENIYEQLIQQFNESCKKGGGCGNFEQKKELGYCASFPDRESLFDAVYKKWPELSIYLENNQTYYWRPFNYYIYHYENKEQPRLACLGFAKHNLDFIIFGTNFLHGHDIIFDREEKKLGFIKADCSRGNHFLRRSHLNHFYTERDEEESGIERIRKFKARFNLSEDAIDFIRGANLELNFGRKFKFINYVLLFVSIIILVIVAVSVISLLIRNKKTGLRYEEPDVVIEEEIDDNKYFK